MLEDNGFTYVCYEEDEKLHYAQKPVVHTPKLTQEQLDGGYRPVLERRYVVVRWYDDDVDNGNLQFFLVRGYTR
jgi:hypothetical protein